MAKTGTFLLRTDPEVLDAMRKWASDELRSVNGQNEFMLRRALRDAGRLRSGGTSAGEADGYEAEGHEADSPETQGRETEGED